MADQSDRTGKRGSPIRATLAEGLGMVPPAHADHPEPGLVGYRRPPLASRFQKGQSGNPKGRPAKAKAKTKATLAETATGRPMKQTQALADYFAQPMKVREDGETREIPRALAYVRLLEQQAARGSVLAARQLFEMTLHFGEEAERDRAEIEAFFRQYKEDYPVVAEREARKGTPLPDFLPHPEDVNIRPDGTVIIDGPYDEKSLANVMLIRAWRDAMHLRMLYDFMRGATGSEQSASLSLPEFVVVWLDHLLPRRWRLASPDMLRREARLMTASPAKLRAEVRRAFETLGLANIADKPMPKVPKRILKRLGLAPKRAGLRSSR